MRIAEIKRTTGETEVFARINLDGTGNYQIDTGIGFLDHMLSHVAVHGLFDLEIKAAGDLHIDVHHTVEDCSLVLGQVVDEALADRKGIVRMGSAYVPMDEALAFVAIDLSGRPYAVVQAGWHGPEVGRVPNSLWAHFLESFAVTARCNLHARVLYGRDDHHQIEAVFKALGRALDTASGLDARRVEQIPSTKGRLQ